MTEFELLADLHLDGQRQGPGSTAITLKALALTGLANKPELHIADLGCGTGASTLVLAEHTDCQITAVDLFPEFLDRLTIEAAQYRLVKKINPLVASIDDLKFEAASFDLIWSEGAIYNIGFARGARYWRSFLKPGGVLAVSEITWLTNERPADIEEYWQSYYPEIDTLENKVAVLEGLGYEMLGRFTLPETCWEEEYYRPLEQRHEAFLERHGNNDLAARVVATDREEIAMYRQYQDSYSYGFYIARKT